MVAEVSLDDGGQIAVHNVWATLDCGIPVQPDNVIAQSVGSIVYGLGLALSERITLKDGVVQQSNFYDYLVPRMREVPQIHCKVIATDNAPTGVGQMTSPLVAPAMASAFHPEAHSVHARTRARGAQRQGRCQLTLLANCHETHLRRHADACRTMSP